MSPFISDVRIGIKKDDFRQQTLYRLFRKDLLISEIELVMQYDLNQLLNMAKTFFEKNLH